LARIAAPAISDILTAINGINRALKGKSYKEFTREWVLRHAVQRGIEIISEASRSLPEQLTRQHPQVPWKQIKGIGNILRHEYHRVADDIIWNVVVNDLPTLKKAILKLRDESKRG